MVSAVQVLFYVVEWKKHHITTQERSFLKPLTVSAMQPVIFSIFLSVQRTRGLEQGPAELETTIIHAIYMYS